MSASSAPWTPQERIRALDRFYNSSGDYPLGSGAHPFSHLSDLQTLESSFRRFGVSDSTPRQHQPLLDNQHQPLLDNRQSNQFHGQAMNGRDNNLLFPSNSQQLWFQKETCANLVCADSHGTRAMQDLMRCLRTEEQISRFMSTLSHVAIPLTKNTNANHVILFSFNQFTPAQSRCLLEVIVQNCYQIAIDQYGCCMLQQCIEKSSGELRDRLIREIINNALNLCVNCYGNYVVQYVLELEDSQIAIALSRQLDGHYVHLSRDKYGSHAVQKCLKSREFSSRRIIAELLSDIDSLLVDPFGNYVIQTAWMVSQDDVRNQLLYYINRNAQLMRCNRYGRKVLEKLNLWS
ncbi:hypothetical protein AALP_AA6G201500 [Arabis alpina]|uniref:PUM-HD domain-containing protein n=1 Tax=Arabis alpina TaxID=50452 RepID=A0A087GQH4_ARAAL|nr:hypothetical protein AALP_AA6G201500 [Arabis alpina]